MIIRREARSGGGLGRHGGRLERRGATLIELVVVGSIFLAVLTALTMIYNATLAVQRSVSLKVDVDREVFAAVRHLEAALRTSRLVQPADWYAPQTVDSIELRPLSLGSDGLPLFTPQGIPLFGNAFTIRFENGELVRTDINRRFARLGTNGRAEFVRASQGVLEMHLQVEKTGFREETTRRDLTFQFCLFNQ